MGRPQFTGPVERPGDTAARRGNVEEFSQSSQSITVDTLYQTATGITVGTDITATPIFIDSASIAYQGGVTTGADVQWRVVVVDSNDNQEWLKYAGSGGDSDGPITLAGLKVLDGWDIRIQIRNQTGSSIDVDIALNYRK